MKDLLPTVTTAALLSAAPDLNNLPAFDWKHLAWTVASAVIAIGLDWLRRWLSTPAPGVQHADPYKDPPS